MKIEKYSVRNILGGVTAQENKKPVAENPPEEPSTASEKDDEGKARVHFYDKLAAPIALGSTTVSWIAAIAGKAMMTCPCPSHLLEAVFVGVAGALLSIGSYFLPALKVKVKQEKTEPKVENEPNDD